MDLSTESESVNQSIMRRKSKWLPKRGLRSAVAAKMMDARLDADVSCEYLKESTENKDQKKVYPSSAEKKYTGCLRCLQLYRGI